MEDKEFAELFKKSVHNMNWCLSEAKKRKMKIHVDFNDEDLLVSKYYRYFTQNDTLKIRDFYIPVPNIHFK